MKYDSGMKNTQTSGTEESYSESVSGRVLAAIAAEEDTSAPALDRTLYDVVDPDALDALVHDSGFQGDVEFTYNGYQVTVHGDGRIDVTAVDDASEQL